QAVDQSLVRGTEVVRGKAEVARQVRVLDEDVRLGGESAEGAAAFFGDEIEADTALAAVELNKGGAEVARAAGLPIAGDIAVKRLDLDDIGAGVGKFDPGVRPRNPLRELDNAEARQRRPAVAGV